MVGKGGKSGKYAGLSNSVKEVLLFDDPFRFAFFLTVVFGGPDWMPRVCVRMFVVQHAVTDPASEKH